MPKYKSGSAFYLFDFASGFETNNKQQWWQIPSFYLMRDPLSNEELINKEMNAIPLKNSNLLLLNKIIFKSWTKKCTSAY